MKLKDYIAGKVADSKKCDCPRCDKPAVTDGKIIVCAKCGVIVLWRLKK